MICSTTVISFLKEKITLGERKSFRRVTMQQFPVGSNLIRLRIDFDIGQRIIQLEIGFTEIATSSYGSGATKQAFQVSILQSSSGNKMKRQCVNSSTVTAEHWTIDARLRRGNRRIAIPHQRAGNESAF